MTGRRDVHEDASVGPCWSEGDAGYDEARSLWNGDIDRKPAVIAQCTTADQVAAAIGFGRAEGLEIAVRGGGHNFAGHGVCEGGLMIDLNQMNTVTVDAEAEAGALRRRRDLGRPRRRDPGARARGSRRRDQPHRRRRPFARRWHRLAQPQGRLSCDNLVSAQWCSPTDSIVTASATENPDLHWALRGGGGNFGVVTEFEFALHDVGPLVQLALFFLAIDAAPKGSAAIRDSFAAPSRRLRPPDRRAQRATGAVRARGAALRSRVHARDRRLGHRPKSTPPPSRPVRDMVKPTFELVDADPVHRAAEDARRQRAVGHSRLREGDLRRRAHRRGDRDRRRAADAQVVADVDHAGLRARRCVREGAARTPPRSAGAAPRSGSSTSRGSRRSPVCSRPSARGCASSSTRWCRSRATRAAT